MENKKPHPLLKIALEIGPILLFFLSYRWATIPEGATEEERQLAQVLFATSVFVPTILASLGISWFLTRTLPKMAVITAIVVVVFGGLTLWLRDDTFIKMKPTIIYLVFASILGLGVLRGQSYLQYLMEDALPLTDVGWMEFTKRFALFFLALAIVNEIVWRGFSTDTWVTFKTFFLPIASIAFVMSQTGLFARHAPPEEE